MRQTALMKDTASLKRFAADIRIRSIQMIHEAGASHVGGCLSMADIIAVLYGQVLRVDPACPTAPDRDRFVLSKGHACASLYVALARSGFFPESWLDSFYKNDGHLFGHATHTGVPGIEVSTGSLGHGLPIAAGMAFAGKRAQQGFRVFCLLSDGECDEGSTWEAAMIAGHHKLDNLVAIVDYNKIQSLGSVPEVLNLEPLADKFAAFGWSTVQIDGHDLDQLQANLQNLPLTPAKPTCLVCHTIKGKGVSFMEDQLLYHYRRPPADEVAKAIVEIEATL